MSPPVDRPHPAWRVAAATAAVLWLVSLCLPVIQHGLLGPPGHPYTLRGWQVFYMAPLMLTWAITVPWIANPLGLTSLAWIAWRGRPPKGLPTIALLVAGSLLIWWPPYSPHANLHAEELLSGCWVWLASFVPMAIVDLATLMKRPVEVR